MNLSIILGTGYESTHSNAACVRTNQILCSVGADVALGNLAWCVAGSGTFGAA